MASRLNKKNKATNTRDIDKSLFVIGTVLAGLVVFMVLLIGNATGKKKTNSRDTYRSVRSIEIDETGGSDIGFSN